MPKTFITHALTAVGLIAAALPAATLAASTGVAAAAEPSCSGELTVRSVEQARELGKLARPKSPSAVPTWLGYSTIASEQFAVSFADTDDDGYYTMALEGGVAVRGQNYGARDFDPTRADYAFVGTGSGNTLTDQDELWSVAEDGAVTASWPNSNGSRTALLIGDDTLNGTPNRGLVLHTNRAAMESSFGAEDFPPVTLMLTEDADSSCGEELPTPQVISFDEDTPTTGFAGRSAMITATGGDSGNPVTLTSGTPEVCTVDAEGEVTYLAAGTCTVAADQEGTEADGDDPGFADAETATTSIAVALEPSTTVVTATADPVVGQDVELTADVTSDSAAADPTPAGTVQFSVDDVEVGDPVAVDADGEATYDAGPLAKGAHDLDAVFTPTDSDVVAGSDDDAVVTVAAADTTTTLTVGRRQVSATVTVAEPGSGLPTGNVVFSVDNTEIGTAALVDGIATLNEAVPAGDARDVAAVYEGDDDYNGSADSTSRTDPVVTTTVASPEPQVNGWYTAPVTVTFTCANPDAELTRPCPAPVTRSKRGADITVARTVRAVDGGTTTVTETFSIDRRGPFLGFKGVEPRTVYPNGVPKRARCTAVDDLSGVDDNGCTLRKRRVEGTNRVILTATAGDVAGNRSTKSIVVFVPRSAGAADISGPR